MDRSADDAGTPRSLELRAGAAVVELRPDAGGRIGQMTVAGQRLLRGEGESEGSGWGFWGSYPLLPWSNRIPAGRFTFRDQTHSVPVNWPDNSALHGLVAWVPWNVVSASETEAVLAVDAAAGPYRVHGRERFELHRDRLDLELSVRNDGPSVVPVGLGIHPWFRGGAVEVPARELWPTVDAIPVGPPQPVTPETDLRERRVPPPLDHCFTGLEAATATVPGCELSWSSECRHIVVYSEDPRWVCVEPVTNANDAFNLEARGVGGTGTHIVDPGEVFAVRYSFRWSDDITR